MNVLQGVWKVRLHLSCANKKQQRSLLFFNYMPMCSPRNAAHLVPFRRTRHQTLRVAHGTVTRTDFSRSASCWTLVHGSTLPSSCWISSHKFSHGFRSASSPVLVPPSSPLCPVPVRSKHSHGLAMERFVRLARFSDIHFTKRPEVGAGLAT